MLLEISQNSQENTCARVSFLITLQTSVFSCEFCQVSKSTFFTEHLQTTASSGTYFERVSRKESLAFAEQIEEQESEFFRESIDVGSLFTSIHLKTTLKFAVTHPWIILKK